MASIRKITPLNSDSKISDKGKLQNNKTHIAQLNASNPQLLQNFLDLIAHNNKSVISFGYAPTQHGTKDKQFVPYIPMTQWLVKPYGQDFDVDTFAPTLSDYAKNKILNEH